MLDLGLSHDDYEIYMLALRSSHRIRAHVRVHDRDEKIIGSLSHPVNHILDGAIHFDATAQPTRELELTVLDPKRKLRFEPNSPVHGALYADKFISVLYEVFVLDPTSTLIGSGRAFGMGDFGEGTFGGPPGAALVEGDWVEAATFWGPITSYNRMGAVVSLGAKGKELLLLAPYTVPQTYQLAIGTRLDDAIRKIAGKTGEVRFLLPDLPQRLQATFPVPKGDEPWKILAGGQRLASDVTESHLTRRPGQARHREPIHRHHTPKGGLVERAPGHQMIFYDGLGRLVVRRVPRNVALRLIAGRDLIASTPPALTFTSDAPNVVEVTGKRLRSSAGAAGQPSVSSRRAFGRAKLPAANPLSPVSLGRNGTEREAIETRETDLKTDEDCWNRAQEVLRQLSDQGLDATFDCLPIPHLEELDRIEVVTSEWAVDFPVRKWSLPLVSTESMSIGYHKRVRKFRRRFSQRLVGRNYHRIHHGGHA